MWWTFSAAIIASSTALLIAFVAYPIQKKKDRELEIHREKRGLFCNMYSCFHAEYDEMKDSGQIWKTQHKTTIAIRNVALISNLRIASAALKYRVANSDYASLIHKRCTTGGKEPSLSEIHARELSLVADWELIEQIRRDLSLSDKNDFDAFSALRAQDRLHPMD